MEDAGSCKPHAHLSYLLHIRLVFDEKANGRRDQLYPLDRQRLKLHKESFLKPLAVLSLMLDIS